MQIMKDCYEIARKSRDKNELIAVIREMTPETMEAKCIIWYLRQNPAYDAEVRLEVDCRVPDIRRSFEFVDDIIACADNTALMKRLYEADANRFGAFVAVNITEPIAIQKMYESGSYEIRCAAVNNEHANSEFLEKVIRETDDECIKRYAQETLEKLSST